MEISRMLTVDAVPTPNPDVLGRLVDGEAVLVLPLDGKVKVLNEVGARIWGLVDGSRTVGEIAAVICQEYEVDLPAAEADCLAFIRELIDRNIVRVA